MNNLVIISIAILLSINFASHSPKTCITLQLIKGYWKLQKKPFFLVTLFTFFVYFVEASIKLVVWYSFSQKCQSDFTYLFIVSLTFILVFTYSSTLFSGIKLQDVLRRSKSFIVQRVWYSFCFEVHLESFLKKDWFIKWTWSFFL